MDSAVVGCRGVSSLATCKLTFLEEECRGRLSLREFAPKDKQENPAHFLF